MNNKEMVDRITAAYKRTLDENTFFIMQSHDERMRAIPYKVLTVVLSITVLVLLGLLGLERGVL